MSTGKPHHRETASPAVVLHTARVKGVFAVAQYFWYYFKFERTHCENHARYA